MPDYRPALNEFPSNFVGLADRECLYITFSADLWGIALTLLIALNSLAALQRYWHIRLLVPRTSFSQLVCLYACTWLCFAFIYHAMFQRDPTSFQLAATTSQRPDYEAIYESAEITAKIDYATSVVAMTATALRSASGRIALREFAKQIDGNVKTTFEMMLAVASLDIGPPSTAADLDLLEAIKEKPSDMLRTVYNEPNPDNSKHKPPPRDMLLFSFTSSTFKNLTARNLTDLQKMYRLLQNWLLVKKIFELHKVPKQWWGFHANVHDNEAIAEFAKSLGFSWDSPININDGLGYLGFASLLHRVRLLRMTSGLSRFLDMLYFSGITLATVGYGDILPNSTVARVAVLSEVALGVVIIAFLVGTYLNTQTDVTTHKPRSKDSKRERLPRVAKRQDRPTWIRLRIVIYVVFLSSFLIIFIPKESIKTFWYFGLFYNKYEAKDEVPLLKCALIMFTNESDKIYEYAKDLGINKENLTNYELKYNECHKIGYESFEDLEKKHIPKILVVEEINTRIRKAYYNIRKFLFISGIFFCFLQFLVLFVKWIRAHNLSFAKLARFRDRKRVTFSNTNRRHHRGCQ